MKITTTKNTAQKDVKMVDLAKLTGSEKQIAWANNIRENALFELVVEVLAVYGREEQKEVEIDDRVIQALNMHTSAAKIIDNKNQYHFVNHNLARVN